MLLSGLSQEAAASAREEAEDLKEKLKTAQAKQQSEHDRIIR